jgi:hypothetical protein
MLLSVLLIDILVVGQNSILMLWNTNNNYIIPNIFVKNSKNNIQIIK